MRCIATGGRFRRDFKKVKNGHFNEQDFKAAVRHLRRGEPLPETFRDHPLTGNYIGRRDCHIRPGLILIYKIDGDTVTLERIGNHAQLFG